MNLLNHIHAFRALAIFYIVALHTLHVFSWENSVNQQKILLILLGNGSMFFLFISGYLFQHLSAKFNVKKYFLTKFRYVITPYIISSLPLIIYFVFFSNSIAPEVSAKPQWLQVIYYYWWGLHMYSMWFIPVITLFHIAGPFFIKLDKIKLIYWLLPLLIIISLITPRSLYPTVNFLHFLSIYVLGMFCSKYKDTINSLLVKNYVLTLLTLAFLSLFFIEYLSLIPQFKTINFLQKIPLIFIILGILIKYQAYIKSQFVVNIANASFGIYFLHPYVLMLFYRASNFFNQHLLTNELTNIPGNLFFQFIASCSVLLASYLFISLIKNILGSKTYLLIGNISSYPFSTKSK